MTDGYLLILYSYDDVTAYLVNKEIFNWVTLTTDFPVNMLDRMEEPVKLEDLNYKDDSHRAMHVCNNLYDETFDKVHEIVTYARENDINLVDSWSGMAY